MIRTLTGKNYYMLQSRLKRLVADFEKRYGDNVERFDGIELEGVDLVLDAVRSLSLFSENKMVVVKSFAQNKDLLSRIESIVESVADTCELVLVDENIDKRSAGYKYLKSNTEFEEFGEVKPFELAKWVYERAKERGLDLGSQEANFLLDRVGPNQMLLDKEIEKLALASGPVTNVVIEELVEKNAQSKVFDMLEALFAGKQKLAWKLYLEQKAQGEDSYKIMGMIVWQLQQLVLAAYAPQKTKSALVEAGVSPYAAEKNLRLASRLSEEQVKSLVVELSDIDYKSKTSADIDSALEAYFTEVALVTS